MKSQLAELGALLDGQMPVLFSFVVLRWTAVRVLHGALRACVPRRLAPACALAGDWLRRVRAIFLLTGTFMLAYWSFWLPPVDLCAEYGSVRVQGLNALLALAVLATCNSVTASAFALSALKAVAGTSSAALLLSPIAAMSATGSASLLFFGFFVWCAIAALGSSQSDAIVVYRLLCHECV